MEKGMYPTYYLHMEKDDGKRVGSHLGLNERTSLCHSSRPVVLQRLSWTLCRFHSGVSNGGPQKEKEQNIQLSHLDGSDQPVPRHQLLHREATVDFLFREKAVSHFGWSRVQKD